MRCDEVIQILSMAERPRDERALAQHLGECDSCAQRAQRAARLDRLWDLTHPEDPSPETWDHVWTSVSAQLDQRSTSADAPVCSGRPRRALFPAGPWRTAAVVGFLGLAQAAAVLLALSLSWDGQAPQRPRFHPAPAESVAEAVVDVPEGQVVYIRSSGADLNVIDVTALEAANGEDPWFNFFNRAEGEADLATVATR